MRILSIPGRRTTTQYIQLFCESLDEAGMTVVDVDSRDALLLRFDVLHLHFPHFYIVEKSPLLACVWFCVFAVVFALLKLLGKRVIYSVHNVTPFRVRNAWLLWPFVGMVHRAANGFVFLNLSSQAEFYRRNKGQEKKPFLMLGHAAYPVVPLDRATRPARRAAIFGETDALLVGYLGYRQARKGLDTILMLPERLPGGRAVRLLVAGAVQPSFAQEDNAILSQVPAEMLVVRNGRLSDDELNELMQTLDIVLLPYTMGWNSGMALLVLSNRARLLGSDLPMFRDLEVAVGAPWVYTFSSTANPGSGFVAALDKAAAAEPSEAERADLERYLEDNSFAAGARRLRGFYGSLFTGSQGQRRDGAVATIDIETAVPRGP